MIEKDFNLNIPRYVDTFEPEAEIDVALVQKEIDAIEAELADVRQRMAKHLKELRCVCLALQSSFGRICRVL